MSFLDCHVLLFFLLQIFQFVILPNCFLIIATIFPTSCFLECFLFLLNCTLFSSYTLRGFFFDFSLMALGSFIINSVYSSWKILFMSFMSAFFIETPIINWKFLYLVFRVIVLLVILRSFGTYLYLLDSSLLSNLDNTCIIVLCILFICPFPFHIPFVIFICLIPCFVQCSVHLLAVKSIHLSDIILVRFGKVVCCSSNLPIAYLTDTNFTG